jgi:hypothetical protein
MKNKLNILMLFTFLTGCQQSTTLSDRDQMQGVSNNESRPITLSITIPDDDQNALLTPNSQPEVDLSLAKGDVDSDGFTVVCETDGTQLAVQLVALGTTGLYDTQKQVSTIEWICPQPGSFNYLGDSLKKTTEIRFKFTTSAGSKILIGHQLESSSLSFSDSEIPKRAFEQAAITFVIDFIKRLQSKTKVTPNNYGEFIETVISAVSKNIATSLLENLLVTSGTSLTALPDLFFDKDLQRAVLYFFSTFSNSIATSVQAALSTTLSTETIELVTSDILSNSGNLFLQAYNKNIETVTSAAGPLLDTPACLNWQVPVTLGLTSQPIHRIALQISRRPDFESQIVLSNVNLSTSDFPVTIPKKIPISHVLYLRTKWSSDATYGSTQVLKLCHRLDLNQDGREELVVTSTGTNPQVHLFLGKSSFVGTRTPDNADVNFSAPGGLTATLGETLSQVAFNDDGYDDLVISERLTTNASNLYVLTSSSSTFSTSSNLTSRSELIASRSTAPPLRAIYRGDINGDKTQDWIFSASGMNLNAGNNIGALYITYGPVIFIDNTFDVESSNVDVQINADQANNNFADDVSVGDINGDGFDDILVSTPRYLDLDGDFFPRIDIIWGSDALASQFDVSATNVTTLTGITAVHGGTLNNTPGEGFRLSDALLADLNGDALQDIVISVDSGTETRGHAYVFYGSTSLDNNLTMDFSNADVTYVGNANARLGAHLRAEDINMDGIDDLLISAPLEVDSTSLSKGAIYVVYGNTTTPATGTSRTLTDNNSTYAIRILDSSKPTGAAWGERFSIINIVGSRFPALVSQWSTGIGNNGAITAYDLREAFGDVTGDIDINLGEFRGPNDATITENNNFGAPVL